LTNSRKCASIIMEERMEPKVGPSDFKAEVEKLHAAGKLPSLEELLSAVGDVREEYAPKILKAREEDDGSNS
jgi:hypothetical protein